MIQENFIKPIVIVSKCLGFDSCRYNGQMIRSEFVEKLKDHVTFIPVCPEVEIGLGVPRKPIRIVMQDGKKVLYQPATETILTGTMNSFIDSFLSSHTDIDGFILKSRSPSCGPRDVKIYPGFSQFSRSFRGSGLFGEKVLEIFDGFLVEDEGRMKNFTIREHFLTSLFVRARFRAVRSGNTLKDLIEFHTIHKLLFMGYNQTQMRILGRIIANQKENEFSEVLKNYEKHLILALEKPPRYTSMINVLQHAFGGFSDHLSKEEKIFFTESLEEYRDERIPLSVLLKLLSAWSIRHNNTYLQNQVFMRPYPSALVDITDSGKGRKL